MGRIKIEVQIDDGIHDEVMSAISEGEYASVGEVVNAALTAWQLKRMVVDVDADRLRRLCEEGLASGPSEPLDAEAIKRKARDVFRARRSVDA